MTQLEEIRARAKAGTSAAIRVIDQADNNEGYVHTKAIDDLRVAVAKEAS